VRVNFERRLTPTKHSRRVTVVQLLAASLLAFVAMPLAGEAPPEVSPVWIACDIDLGVTSVTTQLCMNWAQATASAPRATLIYAGEPI
jgi:hypothetical protein